MEVLHNSHLAVYRQPFGAVPVGGAVTLALDILGEDTEPWSGEWVAEAMVRLWRDGFGEELVPMQPLPLPAGGRRFAAKINLPEEGGLVWYYFLLRLGDGGLLFYGNNPRQQGGVGCLSQEQPPSYQITVWQPPAQENWPVWFSNNICYQIFPDRFCRGANWQACQNAASQPDEWLGPKRFVQQNWYDKPFYTCNSRGDVTRWGFFGGNLEGIRSKLLYLKSLGVGSLYLNPIFLAASNHKYDTADYLRIDPSFGDEADFARLAAEAEQLGVSLILDGVFSHTGADSRYFNKHGNYADVGAYQSEDSPYAAWYKFQSFPEEYTGWWGNKSLPEVDESNPAYQQLIYAAKNSVVRKWLRLGARGWRLDVADELPDSFIAGLRAAAKAEKPDALVLGEVWEDASNKQSYGEKRRYLFGDELDGVMNYPFREAALAFMLGEISAEEMAARFISQLENYPALALANNLNLIGTHDTARILTVLGGELPPLDRGEPAGRQAAEEYELPPERLQLARERLKLLSLLQFTMLGVPCVYYGDEAGCQGLPDPFNRGTYPWGREDEDLLYWYRRLANLRQEYHLLSQGEFWPLALAEDVYACRRFWPKKAQLSSAADHKLDEILVVCNRSPEKTVNLELPLPEHGGCVWAMELLSGREVGGLGAQKSLLQSLPPLSCQVWLLRSQEPARWRPERAAGVLCPISALPPTEGGWLAAAKRFVDYLAMAGQTLWQLLPLNPVGDSGSPYTPVSVFAGQEQLAAELLEQAEGRVPPKDMALYQQFCNDNADWLEDYALFAAISEAYPDCAWQDWPQAEREREDLPALRKIYAESMEQCRCRQFMFWQAWGKLKEYANRHGVRLIGDIPIYAGAASADVWAGRELFLLRGDGWPLAGAGVPPDYFSAEGQNWGHPLYNWPRMRADGFAWWKRRLRRALQAYDYIRLDHFRSFSAFFAVPAGGTPKDGSWLKGPGYEFFAEVERELGRLPVIAEDLGLLDQEVHNLLRLCGYPGMLVYQFAPDRLPELTAEDSPEPVEPDEDLAGRALYSGTHDNQTLCGWLNGQDEPEPQSRAKKIIQLLYSSPAPLVIIPLQDLFGLGDEARLNIPGQAQGNWRWQADWQQFKITLAAELSALTKLTKRGTV